MASVDERQTTVGQPLVEELCVPARHDTVVFMTDNAVGQAEEENLTHLMANLTGDVSPSQLVPFLTSKHTLDYCLLYAARAASESQ